MAVDKAKMLTAIKLCKQFIERGKVVRNTQADLANVLGVTQQEVNGLLNQKLIRSRAIEAALKVLPKELNSVRVK